MGINDIPKFTKVIFNHTILSKFMDICKDSGFMNKYIINKEGPERLLGVDVFAANNQTQLSNIILAYSLHVMRHTQRNGTVNQDYCKVREILDNNPDLKQYLSSVVDLTKEDRQIFCVLALSAFYYFLDRKDITIMIEKRI